MSGYERRGERFIQVTYRRPGEERWRMHNALHPGDPRGSCVATVEGKDIIVVYGWTHQGEPLLWNDGFDRIANLNDGPVELDGPRCRWRWRVTT